MSRALAAFEEAFKGFNYGEEETRDARDWFVNGWAARGPQGHIWFTEADVLAMWACVRRENFTIPDEALDQMKNLLLKIREDASLTTA